eukprot:CAMPEP_0178948798 /NCGR_PEP_ID=MMETSP0789-20121207/5677_1 /TAXON_ID=3005 /ORGANISM="Rhizosolenia setigera, Strain CCMP 1694" /LENGTH=605 /DNA_ID=CAMNT_0020629213 /DNA_START=280 /DNA_END=2094 /DNA_ORIENTATION=+
MWTFLEDSINPAVSKTSSKRILCPETGTYSLPLGQGVLCQNSVRLRPSRNINAIERSKELLKKRQLQVLKQKQEKTTTRAASSARPPHILVYMQDAVSRPALYRNMKATHRAIQDIMDRGKDLGTHVYEFKRHHSMGGSSIINLTPMLTGLAYDDMTSHGNKYEAWAFEEFRRLGYVSINTYNICRPYNERYGDKFNRNGPEHYFPYEMEDIGWFQSLFCDVNKRNWKDRIPENEVQAKCAKTTKDIKGGKSCVSSSENNMGISCLGGRSRASLMVEHYLKVRQDIKDDTGDGVPTFAFLHDYDLHVEKVIDLHRYDEDKAGILKQLEGVFKDTVVFYVSDHGNQQKITLTEQGSIEYKLPFWYLMLPDQVLQERGSDGDHIIDNLNHNQYVLTSQPDVHETMLDLAGGRGLGDDAWWEQHGHDPNLLGSSVLQKLPFNRTCDDIGIPPLACVCSEIMSEDISPNSSQFGMVQREILPKVVKHMNDELEKSNNLISSGVCRELKPKKLESVSWRPITPKVKTFNLRFTVESPRLETMEFIASASKGIMQFRGFHMGTVIQASRFAHWIEQCRQEVTDAGGNHHFCDCVKPPENKYGWNYNRTAED